ncbi:MAG: L-aspartate oxidase [Bdellovibrionaceae bacterium]|nr:L-aspartate oxidase [Pseudobdellovibrionaceae bacterium]
MNNFDFIVVGSGLAGLSFALKASSLGKVAVISKSQLMQTNSWRAQGGLAAVISHTDSFEKHIQDTLIAGDGLCDIPNVKRIIENAPDRITELKDLGVEFDSVNGHFELAQEGGHSHRRILHVDDHTGQALHSHFIRLAQEHPQITLFENLFVSELISEPHPENPLATELTNGSHSKNPFATEPTRDSHPESPFVTEPTSDSHRCTGVKAFNSEHEFHFRAPYVILATGGTGKCFLYTSNWSGATGDGIIMAYNLGAQVSNLEFTQFHPTCLYHPMARNFLISEALRGEGGRLLNSKNEAFMSKYHPLKDLAPRDIVARAIDHEMKSTGSDCVWLDLAYLKNPALQQRFPKIYERCLELGINFLEQPIPVVPAAHYMCGGILVDEHCQSSIEGLYAIGECAETGLHGANRLASNSLLECLVTAEFAYKHIAKQFNSPARPHSSQKHQLPIPSQFSLTDHNKLDHRPTHPKESLQITFQNSDKMDQDHASLPPDGDSHKPHLPEDVKIHITSLWDETRQMMWLNMGIIRSQKLMKRAQRKIGHILEEISELQTESPALIYDPHFMELSHIAQISALMIEAALSRHESRGCHFDHNFPKKKAKVQKSIQQKGKAIEYIEI